jgi:hypothetical protein
MDESTSNKGSASRFDSLHSSGLIELVGTRKRTRNLAAPLLEGEAGEGQVVLLSGEPGIAREIDARTPRHRCGSECLISSRTPKPITASANARAGNIIIGISNSLVGSAFSVMSGTRYTGALTGAVLAMAKGGMGFGSGHTTPVGAFA